MKTIILSAIFLSSFSGFAQENGRVDISIVTRNDEDRQRLACAALVQSLVNSTYYLGYSEGKTQTVDSKLREEQRAAYVALQQSCL